MFYTDSNCKHDMLVREARKMCNCVLFNWPSKYKKKKNRMYFSVPIMKILCDVM